MSPFARSEMFRRIRQESRKRDEQFKPEERGFAYGLFWGILAIGLAGLLWMAVR